MSYNRKVLSWSVLPPIRVDSLAVLSVSTHLSLLLSALNGLVGTAVMSLLLSILVGFELKDAAVEDSANIVLAQDTIFRPEQEISRKPLEKGSTPAEKVHRHTLAFMHSDQVIGIEAAFVATIVLCKYIFEVLRPCDESAKVEE
jgi:hypothetical protein